MAVSVRDVRFFMFITGYRFVKESVKKLVKSASQSWTQTHQDLGWNFLHTITIVDLAAFWSGIAFLQFDKYFFDNNFLLKF